MKPTSAHYLSLGHSYPKYTDFPYPLKLSPQIISYSSGVDPEIASSYPETPPENVADVILGNQILARNEVGSFEMKI